MIDSAKKLLLSPKKIELKELYFVLSTLILAYGFIVYSVDFAKIGIPLSFFESLGSIVRQEAKIFVFEINLFFLLLIALYEFAFRLKNAEKVFEFRPILCLVFLLLVFGLFRTLVDLSVNPILGIRNSSFLWYLLLPLCVLLNPVRAKTIEFVCRLILTYLFYCFLYSFAILWFTPWPVAQWSSAFGMYAQFLLAFFIRNKKIAIFLIALYGIALGVNIYYQFQRTALVGLIIATSFAFLMTLHKAPLRNRFLIRFVLLAIFFLVGTFAWKLDLYLKKRLVDWNLASVSFSKEELELPTDNDPFTKAEGNEKGLEKFRWMMWRDALNLFLENPFFGIGFQKQVVFRVHYEGNRFKTNESWTKDYGTAPVSGPHNSYLNALARIGLVAIFLIALHFLVFYKLFILQYYGALALFFAQVIYSLFNVGLEGPTRSFFLLIAIGLALKLEQDPEPEKLETPIVV